MNYVLSLHFFYEHIYFETMSSIVTCPFTHVDFVLSVSDDRSLHKLAYNLFGNIMKLTVPFTRCNTLSVDDVHAALLVACSSNKQVYRQLVIDLKAAPKNLYGLSAIRPQLLRCHFFGWVRRNLLQRKEQRGNLQQTLQTILQKNHLQKKVV